MRLNLLLVPLLALVSDSAAGANLSNACKPGFTAMEKTLQADYGTISARGGQPIHGITAGGVYYLQMGGVWKKSPSSVRTTSSDRERTW